MAIEVPTNSKDLETAIQDGGNVVDAFSRSRVLALGQRAGVLLPDGRGAESDLLHFTIDDTEGKEIVLLPVFTNAGIIVDPLRRNPDWQSFSILEVDGKELLEHIDHDVTVVIDPWSDLEFKIGPSDRKGPH